MAVLRRIVCLIVRPKAEWERIAAEETSVDALLRGWILPLALPAPVATVIGMSVFDRAWDPVHGYLVPPGEIFAAGATTFFGIVASIFALAAIFFLIAPMFHSQRNYVAALKVATFGSIPVLLAGGTLVLPAMALVGMVGLCHTLFLFWLGAQQVLKVPVGGGAEYVGISMVLLAFVSVFAGAAGSAISLL